MTTRHPTFLYDYPGLHCPPANVFGLRSQKGGKPMSYGFELLISRRLIHGKLYHSLLRNSNVALCGKQPNEHSSWSVYEYQKVTCKKCVGVIEDMAMDLIQGKDENGVW